MATVSRLTEAMAKESKARTEGWPRCDLCGHWTGLHGEWHSRSTEAREDGDCDDCDLCQPVLGGVE